MNLDKRLKRTLRCAQRLPLTDADRLVVMSDCHRGDGSWADDNAKNQHLCFAALTQYYDDSYTLIELGDGDELWKNRRMSDISGEHSDVLWLLSRFYQKRRLYLVYGNHDMVKRNPAWVRRELTSRYDEAGRCRVPLFPNVHIHEAILLHHRETGGELLLLHGHQADPLNDRWWKIARFLVRHLWRPVELIGVQDPPRAAKNNVKKQRIETALEDWARRNSRLLVAGHTHRPVFPEPGTGVYFNDGSCVHPRCITALEIAQGCITLVKWTVQTRRDGTMYVGRELLAGPRPLVDYFAGERKPETAETK